MKLECCCIWRRESMEMRSAGVNNWTIWEEILPHLEANQLAYQLPACRQKTRESWVRDKGQFIIYKIHGS